MGFELKALDVAGLLPGCGLVSCLDTAITEVVRGMTPQRGAPGFFTSFGNIPVPNPGKE